MRYFLAKWVLAMMKGLVVLTCAGGLVALAGPLSAAPAAPETGPAAAERVLSQIELSPHRAVYDIALTGSNVGSSVEQLEGRMVYELGGNRCEGYTQSLRFVTRARAKDGTVSTSDLRTASFEDGLSKRLRFDFKNYLEGQLAEKTSGMAARGWDGRSIKVDVRQPKKKSENLPLQAMFPIQHAKQLIAAAKKGKRILSANFYDGSDNGGKVYATTAVIGKPVAADDTSNDLAPDKLKGGAQPSKVAGWPVAMSYFSRGEDATVNDAAPEFEMSYRFHENGLTSDFVIDHGEFAFKGTLTQLEYLPQQPCNRGSGTAGSGADGKGPGVDRTHGAQ